MMTGAQQRGIDWLQAVLKKLNADMIATAHHGKMLVVLEYRGGALVGIDSTPLATKSMQRIDKTNISG